jgi:hypothetical protein
MVIHTGLFRSENNKFMNEGTVQRPSSQGWTILSLEIKQYGKELQ